MFPLIGVVWSDRGKIESAGFCQDVEDIRHFKRFFSQWPDLAHRTPTYYTLPVMKEIGFTMKGDENWEDR